MITNLRKFEEELAEVGELVTRQAAAEKIREIALFVLVGAYNKTPVDTGFAKSNWRVTIGQAPQSTVYKNYGVEALANVDVIGKALIVLDRVKGFEQVFISNNVAYFDVLEYGGFVPPNPGPSKDNRPGRKGQILVSGGFSVQAPHGMLSVTLAEAYVRFGS